MLSAPIAVPNPFSGGMRVAPLVTPSHDVYTTTFDVTVDLTAVIVDVILMS